MVFASQRQISTPSRPETARFEEIEGDSTMKQKERTKLEGTYPGINIQFPISTLILSGKKTVETRVYPIPPDYIGREMLIIETPGPKGRFKARIVGIIVFGKSFQYKSSAEFYQDKDRHCVSPESPWKWQPGKKKWGWPILQIKQLDKVFPAPPRRGIRFTKDISLNNRIV